MTEHEKPSEPKQDEPAEDSRFPQRFHDLKPCPRKWSYTFPKPPKAE